MGKLQKQQSNKWRVCQGLSSKESTPNQFTCLRFLKAELKVLFKHSEASFHNHCAVFGTTGSQSTAAESFIFSCPSFPQELCWHTDQQLVSMHDCIIPTCLCFSYLQHLQVDSHNEPSIQPCANRGPLYQH